MELSLVAEKLKIGRPGHHIFLCCDSATAKCCRQEEGLVSWNYLKKRIEEINLEEKCTFGAPRPIVLGSVQTAPSRSFTRKEFGIHSCTPEVLERILQEHIIGGKVIEHYQIA